MKKTRRSLVCALRTLFRIAGPALFAASTALMMPLPASAWAVARSHTHHASYAPLPSSSFVETASPKRRKRNTQASHERSAPARSGQGNAPTGRRGHTRPQPAHADVVPIYRAGRSDRGRDLRGTRRSSERGRSSRAERDSVVAEVGRRGGNGNYIARLRTNSPHAHKGSSSQAYPARGPVVVASGPGRAEPGPQPRRSALTTDDFVQAATGAASLRNGATSASNDGVYAEGISHPDDEDRLPHQRNAGDEAVIGTAEAMASPAPVSGPAQRASQAQVVSGFGGELAIASPASADRHGATRRRNHPLAASALPEESAPVSLEEREAITDVAVRSAVLPDIYDRSGRLIMPAPLRGSRDVLVHQNTMAASDGLERIQGDGELDRLRAEHQLVSFPASEGLRVNEDLPANRRYARPWTVLFAQDIARDFFARFHQPLQVNSAVRTVTYQIRLQRVNGNAAAIDGDTASPHLTGQAIDLGKRGMNSAELAWMRGYLLPLMQAGKIDVEEEFQQACFHISVYRRYAAGRRLAHEVAQLNPSRSRASTTDTTAETADQP